MSVHYINAAGVQIPQSDSEIIIKIKDKGKESPAAEGGRGHGELIRLTADDNKALCGFRALREEFGDRNGKNFGNLLQGGELRISLDTGYQVGLAGADSVGHFGEPEAFVPAYLPEVCFFFWLLRKTAELSGRKTRKKNKTTSYLRSAKLWARASI